MCEEEDSHQEPFDGNPFDDMKLITRPRKERINALVAMAEELTRNPEEVWKVSHFAYRVLEWFEDEEAVGADE